MHDPTSPETIGFITVMLVVTLVALAVLVLLLRKNFGDEHSTTPRLVVLGCVVWSIGFVAFRVFGNKAGVVGATIYVALAFMLDVWHGGKKTQPARRRNAPRGRTHESSARRRRSK